MYSRQTISDGVEWQIGALDDGVYVWGPTNQNKCFGKSGGDQYIGGSPRF